MSSGTRRDAVLADALAALASQTRIALLREVQRPKFLKDIEVSAPAEDGGGRLVARQTVREHLEKLIHAGFVRTREVPRGSLTANEYVVNQQAIFSLCEEMRELARLRPASELDADTVGAGRAAMPLAPGPKLVIVKGLDEGTAFRLDPPPKGPGEWVIGRRRGAHAPIDFDPYASAENAVVRWEDGRFTVEDVPESRNGTFVNFERLAAGERRVLDRGDVIGVGRTLLLFRA